MIELRLLHNALVLAEHWNFGRAAKALNISQPTLSSSIQLLEEMTGGPLFDRNARDIVPTYTQSAAIGFDERILRGLQRVAHFPSKIDMLCDLFHDLLEKN